eukprot:EG_transcript_16452
MVHGDASGMSVPTDDAFVRPPPMTDDTQCKVAEMRHRVDALGVPKDLAEWADDACLYRYLRARQLNVDKAMAMLENSLKWRQEFGVGKIMTENMDDIRYLGQVGCNYVHGKDQLGRPVIYMKPRVQLKDPGTQRQQMRHLVYTLERAIWSMENDVEKYVLLIDFNGYSMRTAPNISTQRETMSILQDQYPERLGLAVFVDAPFLFHQTFKLLRPFVDPVTAQKLVFTSGKEKEAFFRANFNLKTLEKEYFGEDAHQYDPEQYFATVPRIAA